MQPAVISPKTATDGGLTRSRRSDMATPTSAKNRVKSGALIGAEHRVRTGDLRLGNEAVRHPRFSTTLPESARTCDFLRVLRLPLRAQLHESSRGFSTFMCPECATIAPQHHAPLTRRHAGGSPTRMFDRARLPAVRAGQVAPLPQHPERDQVRLQGSRLRSSERDLQGSFLKTMPRPPVSSPSADDSASLDDVRRVRAARDARECSGDVLSCALLLRTGGDGVKAQRRAQLEAR